MWLMVNGGVLRFGGSFQSVIELRLPPRLGQPIKTDSRWAEKEGMLIAVPSVIDLLSEELFGPFRLAPLMGLEKFIALCFGQVTRSIVMRCAVVGCSCKVHCTRRIGAVLWKSGFNCRLRLGSDGLGSRSRILPCPAHRRILFGERSNVGTRHVPSLRWRETGSGGGGGTLLAARQVSFIMNTS